MGIRQEAVVTAKGHRRALYEEWEGDHVDDRADGEVPRFASLSERDAFPLVMFRSPLDPIEGDVDIEDDEEGE